MPWIYANKHLKSHKKCLDNIHLESIYYKKEVSILPKMLSMFNIHFLPKDYMGYIYLEKDYDNDW